MLTASFARIDGSSTSSSDWVRAHEALSRLAQGRAAADAEEGRLLLAALRSAADVHLGFGSFGEYVERLFGYKPRSTQEKLRVAEALEELPALASALECGSLSWSAVRELTRVAVAETEERWLEVACGKTVRQLEQLVEGKRPGDDPGTFRPPSERLQVLRFEVEPETYALFREAMTQLRRQTGSTLDDDSALLLMARHVLGGPGDAGRASYQIALSVCTHCGSAAQQAGGRLVAVGADVIEQAHCDGQHLGYIATTAANENAAVERHAQIGAEDHTHDGDAHVGVGAESHSHDAQARLRAAVNHVRPAPRSKQTIPPALRRAALRRDHERCRVPGCSHATFLDLHHIVPRSEGGQHELENLITICGAHHRAAHLGKVLITGSATKPHFRHAGSSEYGQPETPHAIEAHTKVFSALRHLGFRESDVQVVLQQLRERNDLREAGAERLLREALQKLAPPRAKPIRS